MKTLGQFIRQTRDEKDISLREFARKIGCSPAFVSDVELGKRNPSEEVFIKIAHSLSIPVSELKKFDTRPPTEDIRRLSVSDPKLAFAFRTVIHEKIKPEDLLKFVEGLKNKKPKK